MPHHLCLIRRQHPYPGDLRKGSAPLPRRMLLNGQCAIPVPLPAKDRIPASSKMHAVRMPDVAARPAQLLRVLSWREAEMFQTITNIQLVFRQVGMQPDSWVGACQGGGLPHQIGRHRKGEHGANVMRIMAWRWLS